ncbi:MAG: hypothetical protein HZA46_12410 [Planctomycetales bacterium]|nr:hypothetical protein [Planctomycetales bacterium]
MNIFGKICLWLAVIGIIASLVLTSRMLGIRMAWMTQNQKLEEEFQKNQEEIAKRKTELKLKKDELTRLMLDWDRVWDDVAVQVDPAGGSLQAAVGSNRGVQDKQVVWAFQKNQDGSSLLAGDFKVGNIRDELAVLAPNWRLRPGDTQGWQAGNWRVRSLVPSFYGERLTATEVALLVADEDLAAKKDDVVLQTRMVAAANGELDQRMKEINGDQQNDGKELPTEIIKGFLATMLDEEELRNTALATVDQLNHDLKRTTERISRIHKINQQLVKSLPQPSTPATDVSKR